MKNLATVVSSLMALLVMAWLGPGCAGKGQTATDHFGTEVNHPTFKGAGDFFRSLGRVSKILSLKKLDGQPVNTDWIDPAFREKLCLTVTINNHCVG